MKMPKQSLTVQVNVDAELKQKLILYRELLKQSREALLGAVMALAEQDSCEAVGIRAMIKVLDRELEDEHI